MNEIKVSINHNELLSKYLTDTIDFNKHVHDIDKWRKYADGDIGQLLIIIR